MAPSLNRAAPGYEVSLDVTRSEPAGGALTHGAMLRTHRLACQVYDPYSRSMVRV